MVAPHPASSVEDCSTLPLETQVYNDYFHKHESARQFSNHSACQEAPQKLLSSPPPDILPDSRSSSRSSTEQQIKSDSPATSSPVTDASPAFLPIETSNHSGKKRDHRGNIVVSDDCSANPRLSTDLQLAFTKGFSAPLTQLFDTTQADSDPTCLGEDKNDDAIFDRPSPVLSHLHPNTPGLTTSSVPTPDSTVSKNARPSPQPLRAYLSLAESQEVRSIHNGQSHPESSPSPSRLSPGADWFDTPSVSKERMKRLKAETRLQSHLTRLTAPGTRSAVSADGVRFTSDASPRIDAGNLKTPARVSQHAIYVSSGHKPSGRALAFKAAPSSTWARKARLKQPADRIASTPQLGLDPILDDSQSLRSDRLFKASERRVTRTERPESRDIASPKHSVTLTEQSSTRSSHDAGLETTNSVADSQTVKKSDCAPEKLIPRTQPLVSIEDASRHATSSSSAKAIHCSQAIHETSPLRSQQQAPQGSDLKHWTEVPGARAFFPDNKPQNVLNSNATSESEPSVTPDQSIRAHVNDDLTAKRFKSHPAYTLTRPRSALAQIPAEEELALAGAVPKGNDRGRDVHRQGLCDMSQVRPSTAPFPQTDRSITRNPHELPSVEAVLSHQPRGVLSITQDESHILSTANGYNECIPYRVWARFRGANTGPSFYPATCLRKAEHKHRDIYRVRFDDENEDEVESSFIKELVLQNGDAVKVDWPGLRSNVYSICGFSKRISLSPSPMGPLLKTDFNGHSAVSLSLKGSRRSLKNGANSGKERILHDVPVSAIYVSSTMWRPFETRKIKRTFATADTVLALSASISSDVATPPAVQRTPSMACEPGFGVFSNMAFALSFSRRGEQKRQKIRSIIKENGGDILEDGFSRLFKDAGASPVPSMDDNLVAELRRGELTFRNKAAGLQFVALIADLHSRRTKYLQAMVLNLPCLSARWVEDSANKGCIAPWDRYLLPAGLSSYLDGAIRSRVMRGFGLSISPLPQFSEMVKHRSTPLHGRKVLIVIAGERRQAHVFLAQALGAEEVWATNNIESARLMLEAGPCFQVLCVEDDSRVMHGAKTKLMPFVQQPLVSNEHTSGDASSTQPSLSPGRLVSDESLVQSIIMDSYDF